MGEQSGEELSESDIHHILSNKRRQITLTYLFENPGSVKLSKLSEFIANVETDESPPPRNKRNSVYSSLHQNHLPRLDSLGVIRYDKSRKLIELADGAAYVRPFLERQAFKARFRSISYIGFGVVGVTVILGSLLNIPPFALVEPITLLVVYLLIAALLGVRETRRVRARFSN